MGFGWDETDNVRASKKRRERRRTDVRVLGDCEQGDVVLIDGCEMRVAWFWGVDKHMVGLYPLADRFVKMDGSNLLQLPVTAPAKVVKLR